jgi:aconitate hydratase
MEESIEGRVVTVQPDNISTGDLAPDGAEVMAYRSNVPAIAEFTFRLRDPGFRERVREWGGGFIVGGHNYGQGSSREHAALAPLQLGIKAVFAKSYARIHKRNLIAQGIVPLTFIDAGDYDRAQVGQTWRLPEIRRELVEGREEVTVEVIDTGARINVRAELAPREREILVAGGLLRFLKESGPER